MNCKAQTDEIGEDRRGALLSADWGCIRGRWQSAWERKTASNDISISISICKFFNGLAFRAEAGGLAERVIELVGWNVRDNVRTY